ncbi:MAG TPA: YkgJ family cysteine cluster protein [Thermodesulfovibrionales bacterium]|nr:YkgJ family cysteine cluster protein [Thermodesulfovibrionales bacterium]
MVDELFSKYLLEVRKTEHLFKTIQEKYPMSVRCRIHCCDCCYAIFGVFPVEAAYINYHFNRLERRIKRDILRKAEKAETDVVKAKDTLQIFDDKPDMKVYGLGKQRVRCPFLTDREECAFYEKRPIICRIYGVPFSLKNEKKEKSYVCGVSGFQHNVSYPTVKLYKIYDELCRLSEELFKKAGSTHLEKATLMLPLSRILRMPFEVIIKADFEE